MPAVPNVLLNNGVEIPQLGFGVLHVTPDEAVSTIGTALDVGYRHIDTAQMYGNEKEVGRAIARSGLDPAEIFVTSKLSNGQIGFDAALAGFDQTMTDLAVERLDLFLIHWPLPTVRDYVETWRAFERIYAEGRVRAIGVSNFQAAHLRRLLDETGTVPVVNQIEAHPYFAQETLRSFGAEHGIVTQAWYPIARGAVSDDADIIEVAKGYDRTPAQVVLRWHIQLGNVVFPKSVTPSRIRENFAIFDFELSASDMDRISGLDRDGRIGPDPDTFNMVPS